MLFVITGDSYGIIDYTFQKWRCKYDIWPNPWWLSPTLPSKKCDFVSWDDEIPNWMESHNPVMFQTTNQIHVMIRIFHDQTTIERSIERGSSNH